MDCRILRHVTLKSDGHLGCDDSIGYNINLGHVSLDPGWKLKNVLNGPIYSHIRSSFRDGRVPWPGKCEGCDLFSEGANPQDTLNSRIELLVEPTLGCNIVCACCLRKQIIAQGRNTGSLDPAILDRFVSSCSEDKILIDQVHYIGWGEPLLHKNWRHLYDVVERHAPKATQVVTTSGNVDFDTTVGDAALDRLVVSCDGSKQEAYEQYRRQGDLTTVIKFMRDAKSRGNSNMFVEWKYILFEFNDSDDDLKRAQQIAEDIGVDSILFIITNSKWRSERYGIDDSARGMPITSLIATVSPAAAMNKTVAECAPFPFRTSSHIPFANIDKCTFSIGKFLTVEGWALGGIDSYADIVELYIDGQLRGKTQPKLRRTDVADAYPNAPGDRCGFMFRIPGDPNCLPKDVNILVKGQKGSSLTGGPAKWRYPQELSNWRRDMPSFDLSVTA